jgi:hypothetical protein
MKKMLAVCAVALIAFLPACQESLDVTTIVKATQAACAFTPAAAGVIALINAQTGSSGTTATSAVQVAQLICTAVNSIPATTQAQNYALGKEVGVTVQTARGPVAIRGTVYGTKE